MEPENTTVTFVGGPGCPNSLVTGTVTGLLNEGFCEPVRRAEEGERLGGIEALRAGRDWFEIRIRPILRGCFSFL